MRVPCKEKKRRLVLSLIASLSCMVLLGCEQGVEQRSLSGEARGPLASQTTPAPDGQGGNAGRLAPTAEATSPKIVAFGDSLTAGLGVPPHDTYPAQLQRRLDESGFRFRVINAGVSGDTSAGGVRRVDWVLKSKPSLVILELGGNDGLRGVDPKQTQANLDRIIRRLREADVPLVLAGMKLPPNYGRDFTSRFEAIYPELARKYELPLIPFFLDGVALHDDLTQADGIHPTGEGYGVIVDNIMPVIEPLLDDISPRPS